MLDPASHDKNAIAAPLGLFRMTTLPQGWTNSVPMAQSVSVRILQPFRAAFDNRFLDNYVVKGVLVHEADKWESVSGIRKFVQGHVNDLEEVLM